MATDEPETTCEGARSTLLSDERGNDAAMLSQTHGGGAGAVVLPNVACYNPRLPTCLIVSLSTTVLELRAADEQMTRAVRFTKLPHAYGAVFMR